MGLTIKCVAILARKLTVLPNARRQQKNAPEKKESDSEKKEKQLGLTSKAAKVLLQ